jgi:hypothetical protein
LIHEAPHGQYRGRERERESQDRRFSLKYLNENKGHEDPSFPDPKHAYPLSFYATTKALVTAVLQCVKIHDTIKACTTK